MIKCENHSDTEANHIAEMPSSVKEQGQYIRRVSLCDSCAEKIKTIGFKVERFPTEQEKAELLYPNHSPEAALANYRAGREIWDTNGDLW